MKNIHILPTEKPSRFVTSKENKKCYLYSIEEFKNIDKFIEYDSKSWDSQNIYITSDEEIKEGDYYLYLKDNKVYQFIRRYHTKLLRLDIQKKIILTTDQDLIKDGVQGIDDEFLEWFVKNPSCEEVEVLQKGTTTIIFPTPKIDIIGDFIKKEEPIQEILENLENQLKKVIKEHPIDVNEDTYWRGVKIGLETAVEVIKFKVW